VTEDKDSLKFQNDGTFFEGDYRQYITGEKTPKSYRNPALVKAMVNIKMIDTQGYGIHKMFVSQKERFLPMPDYAFQRLMKSSSICREPLLTRITA
jgi:ATP-dependent DNA helicase RecG